MIQRLLVTAAAVLILLVPNGDAVAQGSDAEKLEQFGVEVADLVGRLDLDVPDSPAFAILGITPQNVINPDTPAELAAAVFVGNDDNDNGQEGLALEFRPYLMAKGSDLTLGDYANNPWLARMAISFADSSGTGASDKTDRQSIGFSFTPIDKRDPVSSERISDCLAFAQGEATSQAEGKGKALRQEVRDALASGDSARIKSAEAAMKAWFDGDRDAFLERSAITCMEKHNRETMRAPQLQLGLAYYESEVLDINESGAAAWVSYTFPAGPGSVIAHARFSDDIVRPDSANEGSYLLMDEAVVGGRYRLGDDQRAFLIEAAYVDKQDELGDNDDDYTTALIGAEFRVADSLWIQFAIGDKFGSDGDGSLALSGQFRWAVSKSRLWPQN